MFARRRRPHVAPRDPDFDPAPVAPVQPDGSTEGLRLVVNPFLAVAVGVGSAGVIAALPDLALPMAPLAVVLPVGLIFLLQCHCLDCGATVSYPWRARHACRAVRDRRAAAAWPIRTGIEPRLQLIAWAWLLGALVLLGFLLQRG